ncbi:hypothetical protein FX988_01180 [Paraglaciecola mesophila]|uniref:Uncharacterized protein n=1 Tax=Paraglaciecola mesophila TaxID=197222 RepID=A0A857JI85_9ALTE|nr:cysteine-rich CWC family protein [Paraglaciecola mesophila]QHJ10958.1 hypothetical protein FX988_01180 [Paraglaciecola mesophila]
MRKVEELAIFDDMRCPFCQQDNRCNNAQMVQNTPKQKVPEVQTLSPEPTKNAGNDQQPLKPPNQADCWCFVTSIPRALIDLVPANRQHKQCICQRCVNAFTHDPHMFQRQYCS